MLDVGAWFPELGEIADPGLRDACADLLTHCLQRGGWDEPDALPFVPDLALGNVAHTREVVALALALADALERRAATRIDRDHVRAAALLHDASKWVEQAPRPGAPAEPTDVGVDLPHPGYCVARAIERGLPADVIGAIAAHSPFNAVPTRTPLAVVIHHADMVAMDAALLAAGLPSVCKVRRS